MEIADDESFPTAIEALGPLFKLTEVHLWDDGSKEIRRGSSFPKHIRFKYDDDDNVNEDDCCNGGTNSNLDVHGFADGEVLDGDVLLEEYMDLAQQMSTLGLPLSFQTNKDKNDGTKKGKRNGNSIMSSCSQELGQDGFLQLAKLTEKDNSLDKGFSNAERINLDGMALEENRYDESSACLLAKLSEEENSFDKGFNNAEGINLNDMALEENMCDESFTNLPSNSGTAVEDFASCMTSGQKQPSAVAESSDAFAYNEDVAFGDWRAIWDSYYMRNYFYNVETHESTWHPPPGMEHLALSNNSKESNADVVRGNPDPAISSNESELTSKSSEGEYRTDGKLLDQQVSNITVNGNESQVFDGDFCSLNQPCSSLDIPAESLDVDDNMKQMPSSGNCNSEMTCTIYAEGTVTHLPTAGRLTETVNEVAYDISIAQVNEEGMETVAGEIDYKVIPFATKRKKKARKSRLKKKSLSNDQVQLSKCSVDAYNIAIDKYWCQRYLLFSRFDQGIKMDEEGWFSVTPEPIAGHQAYRCGSGVIIDCFAGVGGNAIQFAKTGCHVIAVDIDPKKIDYAKHNASVYGVEDQIDFVIGDSFSLASIMKADTVFMSPPWGGPEYSRVQTYDMAMLKPHDGQFLFDTFKETASKLVMFLPRNVDLNQLADLCLSAGPLWSVEVEKNFLNDRLKAVTAYFRKASA